MKLLAAGRKCLKGTCCGICNLVNILLICSAIVQSGAIVMAIAGKSIPLPQPALRLLLEATLPEEWMLEWKKADATLDGSIYLSDLQLYHQPSDCIIAEADFVAIDLALDRWSHFGDHSIPRMLVRNLSLFLPAHFSPSGTRSRMLLLPEGQFALQDDKSLTVKHLHALSGSQQFSLSGTIPHHLRSILPESATEPGPAANPIQSALLALEGIQHQLSPFPGYVTAQFQPYGHGLHLQLSGLVEEWETGGFKLHRSLIKAEVDLTSDGVSLQPDGLRATGSLEVELPEHPTARLLGDNLNWELSLLVKQTPPSEATIHLHLAPPLHSDPQQASAILKASLDKADGGLRVDWQLHAYGDSSATGNLLLQAGGESASVAALLTEPREAVLASLPQSFPIELALGSQLLDALCDQLPEHRILTDTDVNKLRFQGKFDRYSASLNGLLLAEDVFIGNTHFEFLKAIASVSRTGLIVEQAIVNKTPTETAYGTYLHKFSDQQFSMRLRGQLLPASLDGFLGKWWQRVFRDMHTPDPLNADVTVWGYWRTGNSILSMTWVEGGGISYREQDLDWVDLRIRNNLDWIYLESLFARHGTGKMAGKLGWQRVPDDSWQPMVLRMESTLEWPVVESLLGGNRLETLSFDAPPEVAAEGVVWWSPERGEEAVDPEWRPRVRFRVSHNGLTSYRGLEVWQLLANGRLEPDMLSLLPVSGYLAGGTLLLELQLEDWRGPAADPQPRELEFTLNGAHYGQTVSQMRRFFKRPAGDETELPQGALYASGLLKWNGETEPNGEGSFSLGEADLGGVHLLGQLSRALDDAGLGITSMNLKQANLPWVLENGVLRVHDGNIRGPVLSLELDGEFDYLNDRLSGNVDVALFSGLVSQMLAPLSRNIGFRLSGSMEEPSWNLRLHPLRWFGDQFTPATQEP